MNLILKLKKFNTFHIYTYRCTQHTISLNYISNTDFRESISRLKSICNGFRSSAKLMPSKINISFHIFRLTFFVSAHRFIKHIK